MPYVNVHIDASDLDESDLVDALEDLGYECIKSGVKTDYESMTGSDFERVEHLAVCGQVDAARQEALYMVGMVIGRSLTH